ncbi:MAG: hypothetical protein K1X51_12155 [Rhodospirillaceae bacterium]|nr:hypothetical protein [Rhodospirillaceae bacterium]
MAESVRPILTRTYETGMQITFEPRSGAVVVRFRGRLTILPGPFSSDREAIDAGEAHCRQCGWRPGPPRPMPTVTLRSAW